MSGHTPSFRRSKASAMFRPFVLPAAFCALSLIAALPAAAQFSTQGPGDGCAPYNDGTINTSCLAVLRNLAFQAATPSDWERLPQDTLAPAASPIEAILPLLSGAFGTGTFPEEAVEFATNDGFSVDFRVTSGVRTNDVSDQIEWVGRLLQDDNGLWHLLQIDRRTTCIVGSFLGPSCP